MIRLTDLAGKGSFTMGGKKFEYGKVYSNPYVNAFKPVNEAEESEDHEVSMAQNQLDSIIKHATELKAKMGEEEKQIPAWIQDHITNSENYISQAASNYHEYGDSNEEVNEAPAKTTGERIQNLNNRIKALKDKMASTKSSEQKNLIQQRLKNALQSLSNIKKDQGIKAPHREGVVNEGKFEPNFAKKIEALIKRELGVSEFQAIGPKTGRVMNRQDYYFHIPNHTHGIVVSKKQFGGQYPDTYYVALTNWQGRPKEETEVNHIKDENVVLKTVSAIAKKYKKQLTYAGMKETKSVNEAGPCWKGYKQVGMKNKNGKEVPNCVPEGKINEAGISKMFIAYLGLQKKVRELEDKQKELLQPYLAAKKSNNVTGMNKAVEALKKNQKTLEMYRRNLNTVETRYIQNLDADAEYTGEI